MKINTDNVEINYQNVLPSNIRHGNINVLPLLPLKVDQLTKTDQALLKRVLQTSSYNLAQARNKNQEIKEIGLALAMN